MVRIPRTLGCMCERIALGPESPLEVGSHRHAATLVRGATYGTIRHRDVIDVGIDVEVGIGRAKRETDLPDLGAVREEPPKDFLGVDTAGLVGDVDMSRPGLAFAPGDQDPVFGHAVPVWLTRPTGGMIVRFGGADC